jgi:hypothetical protein
MRTVEITIRKLIPALAADEGATVLEAAVGLVVLLGVFIAIVQISLALYTSHFVADAAREASRYAVVRGSMSCSTTPNLTNCNVSADEVQTWVRSLGYPGINPQQLSISTTWPSSGSACYPSSSPCNNPGNLVKVAVVYAFPLNIPFWKSATINLKSTSEMVISQ